MTWIANGLAECRSQPAVERDMPVNLVIGISHKTYFGYQQTGEWCERVADIIRATSDEVKASLELFTFPAMPAIARTIACFRETAMMTGAQNVCHAAAGAWTGESSAAMLAEMGCRYVEIGHAERRCHFGESTQMIRQKMERAFAAGLTPVVCIGEPQKMDIDAACEYALAQAGELLEPFDAGTLPAVIFAWEPQWAIGARQPARDEYIRAVCRCLRMALRQRYVSRCRVIYGGSAGPGLLTRLWPDVDGLFLGRFAHDPQAVKAILDEAAALL